jgi:hypothetical protein
MDKALGERIISLGKRIAATFDAGNWREIGLLTGHSHMIDNYPRLLRSLDWHDPDYDGNVLGVLQKIAQQDFNALHDIEKYVTERFPEEGEYISAMPSERRIVFAPNVFTVPETPGESDLAAVNDALQRRISISLQRDCPIL